METINVLMSVNKEFLEYSEEMIFSMLHYCSKPITIYLMYIENELNDKDIQKLTEFVEKTGNGTLIPILFDAKCIEGVPTTIDDGSYFGLETYSRLFGAFKVPKEVNRLLYLDVDMICTGDISSLYDIDFDGKLFVACRDLGIEEVDLERLQFPKDYEYVNAGVLLINVQKIRNLYKEEDMVKLIMKNLKYIKYCDQDFLNKQFIDNIKIIDSKYNLMAKCVRYKDLKEKPVIIHYAGSIKPWQDNVSRFEEEYLEPYYKAMELQGNSKKEKLEKLKQIHEKNGYRKERKKKILVFGAARGAVIRAKQMGYYVIASDKEIHAEGEKFVDRYVQIKYEDFDSNLKLAIEENVDGVLVATAEAVEVGAYVASKLDFPGLNYDVAKLCMSKYNVRKKMLESNITNVPQFFEISKVKELDNIKTKIKFPVILKPSSGLGSLCIFKVNDYDELLKHIEEVINGSLNKKALIETFIEGKEYGVEAFVNNGTISILAITKKNMTKLPYRVELGHIVPSGLSYEVEEKIKDTVKKVIKSLCINFGPVNFDLILSNDNEPYIVDLNPRMGGNCISSHVVPLSTGIDYLGNIIKQAMGEEDIDISPKYSKSVVIRVLDLDEQVVRRLPDFDELIDDEIVDISFFKEIGDKIDKFISCAERSGYVIACGDDVDKLIKKAELSRDRINCQIG